MIIADNAEDPKAEVANVAAIRAKYGHEYYNIIGLKVLLDGVTEAHTAWLLKDYDDQPGYHGVERFNNHDKMVEPDSRGRQGGALRPCPLRRRRCDPLHAGLY